MIKNADKNIYEIHPAVADLYDEYFTETDDVDFILRLLGERSNWRILEPFCGSGRILLELARKGHQLFGIDRSEHFLHRLQVKTYLLSEQNRQKIEFKKGDVLHSSWSGEMDLVILASNCFYELAEAEEQENCIRKAYSALCPGGFLYVDNDHMEGNLASDWQTYEETEAFPTGKTRAGVVLQSTRQTIWFDTGKRLVKFKRKISIREPQGNVKNIVIFQKKHPVSKPEVEKWIINNGFSILKVFGDYEGNIYIRNSPRAIFWAQKTC